MAFWWVYGNSGLNFIASLFRTPKGIPEITFFALNTSPP